MPNSHIDRAARGGAGGTPGQGAGPRWALRSAFAAALVLCHVFAQAAPAQAPLSAFASEVRRDAEWFSGYPSRVVGQPGHDEAMDALQERLEAVPGVQVWAHEFPVVAPQTIEATLTLESGPFAGPHRIYPFWPASARLNTTPAEGIDGDLVYIGKGSFDEMPAQSLRGQIAVMETASGERWPNAGAFGARAILFLGSQAETHFDLRTHELLIPLNLPRFYVPEGALADALRSGRITRGHLYSKGAWREVKGKNLYALAPSREPEAGRKAIMVAVQADTMCMVPEIAPGADAAVDVAVAMAMLRHFAGNPPEHPVLFAFIDSFAINMKGMRYMMATLAVSPGSRQDTVRFDVKRLKEYRQYAEVAEKLRDDPGAIFKLYQSEYRPVHGFIKDEASQSVLQIENLMGPLRLRLYKAKDLDPAEAERMQDEIDRLSVRRTQFNTARARMLKGPEKTLLARGASWFGLGDEPSDTQALDFISDDLTEYAAELWRRAQERIDGQVADVEARLARVKMRDELEAGICRVLNLPEGVNVPVSFLFGIDLSDSGIVAGPNTMGRFLHTQATTSAAQFMQWLEKTDWDDVAANVSGNLSCAVSAETWTTGDSKNSYFTGEMYMFTAAALSFGLPQVSWATLDGYHVKADTPQNRPGRLQWDRLGPQVDVTVELLKRFGNDTSFKPQGGLGAKWRTLEAKLVAQAPGEPVARLPQKGYLASLNVGIAAGIVQPGRYIPNWWLCGVTGIRRQEFTFSRWDGLFFIEDIPAGMWESVARQSIQAHLPAEDGSIVSTIDLNGIGQGTTFNTDLRAADASPISGQVFPCKEMRAFQLYDPRFLTAMDGITIIDAPRGNPPKRLNFGLSNGLVSGLTEPFVRWQVIMRMGITTNRLLLLNVQEDIIESDASVRDAAIGFGMDERLPRITAHQAARDMFLLDRRRIRDFRKAGIRSKVIEDIHGRTEVLLAQAEEALERDDGGALFYAASGALSNEIRAYKAVRHLGNDVVRAVVFLLLALIPFSFAMERLLFASPHAYRQIGYSALIFLVMTAVLGSFHPAFRITSQPLIIVMAFGIIFTSFLVLMVVFLKFKANMDEMKSDRAESSGARASGMGLVSTAVSLGLANMRKRKLRTALTGFTIILITFAMLCFTSTSTYVSQKDRRLDLKEPAPYTGVLMRQPSQRDMLRHNKDYFENILANITAGGGASAQPLAIDPEKDVAYRYWWVKDFAFDMWRIHVKNPANCQQVSLSAALGLNGTESSFTAVAGALPNWERFAELERAFTETQRGGCYIAQEVAEELGAAAGDTVLVAGYSLEIVGVFDPDALEAIVGLDGRSILPVNYGAMSYSERLIKMSGNAMIVASTSNTPLMASEIQSGAGMTLEEELPYESAGRVIVVPAPLLARMDPTRDTSLRSMAVRTGTIEAARAVAAETGRRFAYPAFYGSPEAGVRILLFIPSLPQSPRSLAILIVLAGLIIFNTMMSSMAERKGEIFIYTSMGLAPLHIGFLFLAEAATYGLMGSIFGYVAGQGVATFMDNMGWMGGLSLNYSGTHAIATMAMVVTITVVSSLIPAYFAGRMAVPSNRMRWDVPEPVKGVITDRLPFTVTAKTANGILLYLHDYFDAHRDGTIGCFMTDRLEYTSSEEDPSLRGLSGTVSLAPYDMGVLQDFELTVRPTDMEDVLEIDLALRHQAGQTAMWVRLNRIFLGNLRRQLLGWRNLKAGRILKYISDAGQRLAAGS